jgi:hypothetical protein
MIGFRDIIKQDGLMSKEAEKILKNVMKLAFDELSAANAAAHMLCRPTR